MSLHLPIGCDTIIPTSYLAHFAETSLLFNVTGIKDHIGRNAYGNVTSFEKLARIPVSKHEGSAFDRFYRSYQKT